METIVLRFAELLRASGISVSTQEITDCIRLIKESDIPRIGKYEFYQILNTAMIKTPWGSDYAAWLVELYIEPDTEILNDRLGLLSRGSGNGGKNATARSDEQLLQAVLSGNSAFLYTAVRNSGFILDILMEDDTLALEHFQEQSGRNNIAKRLKDLYESKELTEDAYLSSLSCIAEWDEFLKEEIDRLAERNMSRRFLLNKLEHHNPRTASFLDAGADMLSDMEREMMKLGKKIPSRLGRRKKLSKRGAVSLSHTVRKSIKTGGVPLKLLKVSRKRTKPDLWILCDMSNSVKQFVYFILMFAYSAQERYGSIRTFFFVDRIVEATDHFLRTDWTYALNHLPAIRGYNMTGYSQYGLAFEQFEEEFLPQLGAKTTVFILGDAKNNGSKNTGVSVVEKIGSQASHLYWLNPYPESEWRSSDSVMEQYRPYCSGVFPCSNIEELERFIQSI
ncbi:MAG: VWA domain-containing protein [Anaerofustis sp.]